jgi:cytochrome c-type biogenesis protein CcmH
MARRRASWLPWIALGAVLVVALVVLVVRSQPSNSPAARAARLDNELKCPDCQGESIANSNTDSARTIRADVLQRIQQGQSDAEIRAYYVSNYPDILLRPDSHGIGFIAWGLPVIVIVAGLGGLFLAMRRWGRQPRLAASADDETLVARAREEQQQP